MPFIVRTEKTTASLQRIVDEIYGLDGYQSVRAIIDSGETEKCISSSIGSISLLGFLNKGMSITLAKSPTLEEFGIWSERVLIPQHQDILTGSHQLQLQAKNGRPTVIETVGRQRETRAAIDLAERYVAVAKKLLTQFSSQGEIA